MYVVQQWQIASKQGYVLNDSGSFTYHLNVFTNVFVKFHFMINLLFDTYMYIYIYIHIYIYTKIIVLV